MDTIKVRLEIKHLKTIALFSSLHEEELEGILDKLRIRKFRKNDTILYEKDTSEYMYIILEGKVKVVQMTREGKEILLAIHESGEFFGELSLIDGKTSPATIIAAEECTVCIISKKDFFFLINHEKKILENLLLILCSRFRESWEKIQLLNLKNAAQRIKILFFILAGKYGDRSERGVRLNIKLTHQELANMSGMTREAVTRVLQRWQEEGEIRVLKDKTIYLSRKFLEDDFGFSF